MVRNPSLGRPPRPLCERLQAQLDRDPHIDLGQAVAAFPNAPSADCWSVVHEPPARGNKRRRPTVRYNGKKMSAAMALFCEIAACDVSVRGRVRPLCNTWRCINPYHWNYTPKVPDIPDRLWYAVMAETLPAGEVDQLVECMREIKPSISLKEMRELVGDDYAPRTIEEAHRRLQDPTNVPPT